jgi:hypothetical protein
MAERSPFLDLIEIPAIGALFHQYLGSEERKQARLACRALCMLVRGTKHQNPLGCLPPTLVSLMLLCA